MNPNHSSKRVSYHGNDAHAPILCLEQAQPKEECEDRTKTLVPDESKDSGLVLQRYYHYLQQMGLLNELDSLEFLPRLVRRKRNAAYDLVGVEKNPGPVTGKKLLKLLRQTGTAIPAAAPSAQQKKQKRKKSQGRLPLSLTGGASIRSMSAAGPLIGAAASYASMQNSGKAQVLRNSIDSCRMVHRELVASIVGTVAFSTVSFPVNPGMASCFPWLSIEAQGWEKYRFNYVRFCAYTRTGSTTPGSQSLIMDYDAADAAPATEEIASTYFGTIEDAPWKDSCMSLDPARLSVEKFIRSGPLAPNLDIKTYDVGNFYVGTTDGTAVNWSKLWVEYDVVLINPQLPSTGSGNLLAGTLLSTANQSSTAIFGTTNIIVGAYGISGSGGNVVTVTGLVIGVEYRCTAVLVGTVLSVFSETLTGGTSVQTAPSMANAAATQIACVNSFNATASTVVLTYTVTGTTVTSFEFTIAALPSGSGF
jgi:hypothetical protein